MGEKGQLILKAAAVRSENNKLASQFSNTKNQLKVILTRSEGGEPSKNVAKAAVDAWESKQRLLNQQFQQCEEAIQSLNDTIVKVAVEHENHVEKVQQDQANLEENTEQLSQYYHTNITHVADIVKDLD